MKIKFIVASFIAILNSGAFSAEEKEGGYTAVSSNHQMVGGSENLGLYLRNTYSSIHGYRGFFFQVADNYSMLYGDIEASGNRNCLSVTYSLREDREMPPEFRVVALDLVLNYFAPREGNLRIGQFKINFKGEHQLIYLRLKYPEERKIVSLAEAYHSHTPEEIQQLAEHTLFTENLSFTLDR